MNWKLIAMCGHYCGWCERTIPGTKDECPTCQVARGDMWWGECRVAKCCSERGLQHCGLCEDLPCDKLRWAFNHPDHGDNGERLANLKVWARGEGTLIKYGTFAEKRTEGD